MRKYLVGMVGFVLSCGPADQSIREMSRVTPSGLVAYYRDSPHGRAYHGQRVQVRLDPLSYTVDGRDVLYYTGLPAAPPVIVFRCVDPVDAEPAKHTLVVTGVCRGALRDGIRKADRVSFVIHCDECAVTRVEPR
jgi:hypothetical protein